MMKINSRRDSHEGTKDTKNTMFLMRIYLMSLALMFAGCMLYDTGMFIKHKTDEVIPGSNPGNDDPVIVHDCAVDGHVLGEAAIITATCVATGSETKPCTKCDYKKIDTIPVNDNHSLSANANISTGVKLQTCTRGCGKINNYTFDYRIGDTAPGVGGVVYYVADGQNGRSLGFTLYNTATDTVGTTAYYLVAAPNDAVGTWPWSVNNTTNSIAGIESGIGTGKRNTMILLLSEESDAAANKAYYYRINNEDFGTWFLPSANELTQLAASINLNSTTYYWSSSQASLNTGVVLLPNGTTNTSVKTNLYSVRPIRAF